MNVSAGQKGRAGELRVASELFLRGFHPSLSLDNDEVDLILDNGVRIQVKTSSKDDRGRYLFNFKGWKRIGGQRMQVRHELKNVDFIILWGIDEDLFLIFPKSVLKDRINLNIPGPSVQQRWAWKNSLMREILEYKNQWDLLRSKEVKKS